LSILAAALAALAWLLGAGACAPGRAVYDKPGVTYQEWRRDNAECREAALTAQDGGSEAETYARCMRARGYHMRDR
jgi:hypothetical protein